MLLLDWSHSLSDSTGHQRQWIKPMARIWRCQFSAICICQRSLLWSLLPNSCTKIGAMSTILVLCSKHASSLFPSCFSFFLNLILAPHLIISSLVGFMLFIAGMKKQHIAILGLTGGVVGFFALIMEEYRLRRLLTFGILGKYMMVKDIKSFKDGLRCTMVVSQDRVWVFQYPNDTFFLNHGQTLSQQSSEKNLDFLALCSSLLAIWYLLWRGFYIAKMLEMRLACILPCCHTHAGHGSRI